MLRNILLLVAISYAFAQLHSVCHSNVQWTEAQVVQTLADLCDRNNNGVITAPEVVVCIGEILQSSLPASHSEILAMNYEALIALMGSSGFSIEKQDFIDKWHARFHDSHDFIEATFDAFDNNGNGEWSIEEVDDILNHLLDSVDNGDRRISKIEFIVFFTDIYENC